MKLAALVATSAAVAQASGRNAKRDALASCLTALEPGEVVPAVHYLSGSLPQGRVGIGPSLLRRCAGIPAATTPAIEVADLDRTLDELAKAKGKGVAAARQELLRKLFAGATAAERRFLIPLFIGELRQGALEGVMVEAIAKAWQAAASEVRRAFMLSGDLAATASIAATAGEAGLRQVRLRVGTPLQSMLAQTADGVDDVFERLKDAGPLVLDWKMDGARVQVHKDGDDVAVFSRRLNDVSASVPEVVATTRAMPAQTLVLDGEAIALTASGRPQPFQVTMRRFGRRQDVDAMQAALPLGVHFFDCLHADGEDLIGDACTARLQRLDDVVPAANRMPRCVTDQRAVAAAFLRDALAGGHEGVMAKHPGAPYQAGGRGGGWLKVKHTHTLDLVVLAAEWGSGRRRGWLSNLHLGARDEATGGFVMLGKTFKGLTDALLKWQTEALLELAIERAGAVVHVEPKLVVEIAFNDVQTSPHYPGGVALRFARVKRYRQDKAPSDADTIAAVRALLP